jgi:hypothetical protein
MGRTLNLPSILSTISPRAGVQFVGGEDMCPPMLTLAILQRLPESASDPGRFGVEEIVGLEENEP